MRLALALALAASLAACSAPNADLLPANAPAGPIEVATQPVPLNAQDPAQTGIGAFRYAGGLALSSAGTTRLHGLSDLAVTPDGALHSQSDEADYLQARIVLDAQGRLSGLADARISRLVGIDNRPLRDKREADAEGLALLADGSRLVSFERHDRIWRYAPGGGHPTPAPFPADVRFRDNESLEALGAWPAAGADAYLVGSEAGRVWLCRLSGGCAELSSFARPPEGFALVALTAATTQQGPLLVVLHRSFSPGQGARARVSLMRLSGPLDHGLQAQTVASFQIDGALTRDNFEGVAAVRRPDGALRLYLVSDDNFNPAQRTLLMAFDWTPPAAPPG